jgi:hypothetical protein
MKEWPETRGWEGVFYFYKSSWRTPMHQSIVPETPTYHLLLSSMPGCLHACTVLKPTVLGVQNCENSVFNNLNNNSGLQFSTVPDTDRTMHPLRYDQLTFSTRTISLLWPAMNDLFATTVVVTIEQSDRNSGTEKESFQEDKKTAGFRVRSGGPLRKRICSVLVYRYCLPLCGNIR